MLRKFNLQLIKWEKLTVHVAKRPHVLPNGHHHSPSVGSFQLDQEGVVRHLFFFAKNEIILSTAINTGSQRFTVLPQRPEIFPDLPLGLHELQLDLARLVRHLDGAGPVHLVLEDYLIGEDGVVVDQGHR